MGAGETNDVAVRMENSRILQIKNQNAMLRGECASVYDETLAKRDGNYYRQGIIKSVNDTAEFLNDVESN